MKRIKNLTAAAGLACASMGGMTSAEAQTPSFGVTMYGVIDQYFNYMHSSSGAKVKSLEDGSWLRSRIGFRGIEDLGDGFYAKFQFEGGFSTDTGTQADATRFFDRQTWVGLGTTTIGEFRMGRQNGPIQSHGGYVDYTARNLGSMINNFGVPSRYDNDMAYLSPKFGGFQFEGHVALPESPVGNHPLIYQAWLDYSISDYRVGYMGLRGRPPSNAAIDEDVKYDNVYANWNYGKGKVYLAFVRSNNNTATAVSNNAGTILGNVGGYNAGTNPDLRNFYNIWQVSADYQATGQLRIGALWGRIQDKSGRDRGANGGSIGAYYDLSKRTMLYGGYVKILNHSKARYSFNINSYSVTTGGDPGAAVFGIVHFF